MVFIKSATQISIQQPLCEDWLATPQTYDTQFVRSVDPDFRQWLNPMELRRLGKILRRALVTAIKAMDPSPASLPDAIITGTGLGCIESTEQFLEQLCRDGEEMLKPTHFMQSTHNTISSLIAIHSKCHGYNSTYSHKSVSFDSALLDAFLQLRLGDIRTALVTGNDEMTPSYFSILQRAGFLGQPHQVPASEASVAMMLTTDSNNALCQLADVKLSFHPATIPCAFPQGSTPDAILVGTNGCAANDCVYDQLLKHLPPAPLLHYKHIFGESYSASALGLYAAAHIVSRGEAPAFMRCDGIDNPLPVRTLLVLNHSEGTAFSYILLKNLKSQSSNLESVNL
jgi:hypothetical protein